MPVAASPADAMAAHPARAIEPRLLTPEVAAAYCGVSERTFLAWLEKGQLSIIVLPSAQDPTKKLRKVLIDRRDLDRWLDERARR